MLFDTLHGDRLDNVQSTELFEAIQAKYSSVSVEWLDKTIKSKPKWVRTTWKIAEIKSILCRWKPKPVSKKSTTQSSKSKDKSKSVPTTGRGASKRAKTNTNA